MDVSVLQKTLPTHLRKFATQDLLDKIDALETNPVIADQIKDNLVSYTGVLNEPNASIQDYLNCIVYISHKMRGDTAVVCYAKTFPQRYAGLVARGETDKEISKYASAVEKGKMFVAIMQQAIVPSWILNQDVFQKAIRVQAELMVTATSEKVRCDAANSLLTHLARPKEVAPMVQINMGNNSELDSLKNAMVDLALNQQGRIVQGETPKTIAGEVIVNGD